MVRSTRGKTYPTTILAARENRKHLTEAETILWEALRERRLAGLKFRKQHPLDHFVLDFFCVEKMLAVEVDGSIHESDEQKELDRERTRQLSEKGVRVIRFQNDNIFKNLELVLKTIAALCEEIK